MSEANGKTILLVEDESVIALRERKALEKYGYKVIVAGSGEEAIEAFGNGRPIDLVLMDINLGSGLDGTETAQTILKGNDVPVVFLSSHSEPEVVEKTEKITSYGYILKESSHTVLDASIKMAFKLFSTNRRLKETEARQQAMISNISDVISILGTDGSVRYVSPSVERWFGWKPEDFIGQDRWITVHPDDLERVRTAFARFLDGEVAESTIEYRYRCKDGGYKLVSLTAVDMSRDPAVGGVLINYRDITEQKRKEIALRESEGKYRLIFDYSPLGFMVFDEKSAIRDCNDRFAQIIGSPKEKILGLSILELPDETVVSQVKAALGGKIGVYEGEYRSVTGNKTTPVRVTFAPLAGKDEDSFRGVGIVEDISKRRAAEEALAKEQYLLQTLMDTTPDHIFFKDRESRFIKISKSQIRKFGLRDESEILGKTDFDFFAEDHARQAYDDEQAIMKTGALLKKEERETWIGRPDTWAYSIKLPLKDRLGNTIGTFGVSRDITEIKEAQKALKESNERCRGIIERISDYIFTVYLDKGRIAKTIHNPACVSVTGYTTEEFAADPYLWFDMILPEDRDLVERHATGILSEVLPEAIEHRIRRKDGALRWIRNTPVLHRDSNGSLASYDGIVVDITERKNAEEKVQKLLVEKELILKEVHHRIKNNMNTITSLLSLQGSTLTDSRAIRALEDAGSRVQSMMVLYDELYPSSSFSDVPVGKYLPALAERIVKNFPNGGRVKIEAAIQDFTLGAKILQPLGLIMNELLTNIMKYAFAGREGGSIGISASLNGTRVAIGIRDDGKGLPESIDFEHSSGFGLMLVKNLTKQLEGAIRIERGKGTSIVLEFDR
jgi:PAS domain S-box-containing protein